MRTLSQAAQATQGSLANASQEPSAGTAQLEAARAAILVHIEQTLADVAATLLKGGGTKADTTGQKGQTSQPPPAAPGSVIPAPTAGTSDPLTAALNSLRSLIAKAPPSVLYKVGLSSLVAPPAPLAIQFPAVIQKDIAQLIARYNEHLEVLKQDPSAVFDFKLIRDTKELARLLIQGKGSTKAVAEPNGKPTGTGEVNQSGAKAAASTAEQLAKQLSDSPAKFVEGSAVKAKGQAGVNALPGGNKSVGAEGKASFGTPSPLLAQAKNNAGTLSTPIFAKDAPSSQPKLNGTNVAPGEAQIASITTSAQSAAAHFISSEGEVGAKPSTPGQFEFLSKIIQDLAQFSLIDPAQAAKLSEVIQQALARATAQTQGQEAVTKGVQPGLEALDRTLAQADKLQEPFRIQFEVANLRVAESIAQQVARIGLQVSLSAVNEKGGVTVTIETGEGNARTDSANPGANPDRPAHEFTAKSRAEPNTTQQRQASPELAAEHQRPTPGQDPPMFRFENADRAAPPVGEQRTADHVQNPHQAPYAPRSQDPNSPNFVGFAPSADIPGDVPGVDGEGASEPGGFGEPRLALEYHPTEILDPVGDFTGTSATKSYGPAPRSSSDPFEIDFEYLN